MVGGTCQVTNECHHHVLVAMVHGEQGVQLLAVMMVDVVIISGDSGSGGGQDLLQTLSVVVVVAQW